MCTHIQYTLPCYSIHVIKLFRTKRCGHILKACSWLAMNNTKSYTQYWRNGVYLAETCLCHWVWVICLTIFLIIVFEVKMHPLCKASVFLLEWDRVPVSVLTCWVRSFMLITESRIHEVFMIHCCSSKCFSTLSPPTWGEDGTWDRKGLIQELAKLG